MSDSLWPRGLQHARVPCPSLTPRACLNSCPSSRWCHPTISFSIIPSPPAFNLFHHHSLFWWVGSSHQWPKYWSLWFSISSPKTIEDWLPLGWTGLISLQSKELSRVLSNITMKKHQFFRIQPSSRSNLHIHTWALTIRIFVGKITSLIFYTLSRFVIDFVPRSNCLNFMTTVTIWSNFGAPKNEVCHCFHFSSICLQWSDGSGCLFLVFWMLSFKSGFSISSFFFIKRFFSSSSFFAIRVVPSVYLHYWYFSQQSWLQLVLQPV